VGDDDIERAHMGDRDATRVLAMRLLPVIQAAVARRLYPLARARGRDPMAERDDLVSGVWVKLFENDWRVLRNFDPARGTLEGYVTTIADRHVIAVFRVRSRDPYGEIPMTDDELEAQSDAEVGLEQRTWARGELDDLYEFLRSRLDERGLLLFHMLEVESLSIAEVCERAEMSRGALYQWRARFRRLARQWRMDRR
jgi:RNA polymerase sigma factor (sigma-70 family)